MKYSKLSNYNIKKILQCFNRYYQIFRAKIVEFQEQSLKRFSGDIEIDESYFGSRHLGDKRGRGNKSKIPVIGLLKRNGRVYTEIIPDVSKRTLMPIISQLVESSKSNIYTDKWKSYDGLVFSGYKHYRINHSKEFARSHNHINGIESFWSYTKRKMRKHNGIRRNKFYIYLKESEFRFNHRNQNIYNVLLKIIFK